VRSASRKEVIVKWPKYEFYISVLAAIAAGVISAAIFSAKSEPATIQYPQKTSAGCFGFGDGTTQGWILDQLYDTDAAPLKKVKTLKGSFYAPFILLNHNNIALEANASYYLITDKAVKSCDIYFESPNLANKQYWKNIKGYSIDVRREFYSPCGDPPSKFFVQLQMRLLNTTTQKDTLIAELTQGGTTFIFRDIKLNTPNHFEWKPPLLSNPNFKVKQIRVRCVMPGWIADGECAYRGAWKIGNVCPIK
jgi:hypothetical protein